MKRILIACLILCGCTGPKISTLRPLPDQSAPSGMFAPTLHSLDSAQPVTPDAYGPGIGMAATGQPVHLAPALPGYGGDYSNSQVQQPNAYGPGIHMDQYGRPVSWRGGW